MKILLAAFLLTTSAFAQDLSGRWINTEDGTDVNFLKVGREFRQYNTSYVRDQWGRVLYKIDQHMSVPVGSKFGKVSFYDSRGCSFKDLPVLMEYQNPSAVNFLVTVPRYKFQTITERNDPRRPVVRHKCRVIEYVEVPVELYRY